MPGAPLLVVINKTSHRIEVSCDANSRIALAEQWLNDFPTDSELLVLADRTEAANEFHLRVAASRGAWFGMRRATLSGLAARLAQPQLARSGLASVTALSFVAVVARVIHTLHQQGRFTYFGPVALQPGFPVAVAKTLEELRMNEVEAKALERLGRGGKDLAAITDLVARELELKHLADRATIFQIARSMTPEQPLPLLLLDLSVRNTREEKLIQALAKTSSAVLATVPEGDERTILALERVFGSQRNIVTYSNSTSISNAKQHLFQESSPPQSTLDESVNVASWPGEPRECVEIVRSIQAEAARGVPFDQMAVCLNSPGEYRLHLKEAFSRAQISAYFAEGLAAPDPAGRGLLALLACAGDGLSASRFAEYLSLSQVPIVDEHERTNWVPPRDELLGAIADQEPVEEIAATPEETEPPVPQAPWRWERLLVDSAVIGGKHRWEKRLNGLKNELELRLSNLGDEEESRARSIERQIQDLQHLSAFALPLIERLASLPERATWADWLTHLRELTTSSLRHPEGVLATLAELEPMGPVGPVGLYEVQLVLGPRLRELAVQPPRRRYGMVYVCPVHAVRGLSFRIVFVPGLAERVFPRKIVEDAILSDEQREEIDAGLLSRRDRLEHERLGLRLAVGAAGERLYLSYPRVDIQQSRPRVPSFYALETLHAAEGVLPGFDDLARRAESATRARLGWPAPSSPTDALDEAEYDLALLSTLVDADEATVKGSAHYLLTANPHLARALRARTRRWLKRWTVSDGLVDPDSLAIKALERHQFSARPFSATALQNYSSCPYKFFLSALLRLQPREAPAPLETMDPLTRGSIFHEAQFEVLTKLKAEGLLPLAARSLKHALDLSDAAIQRLSEEFADRLAPAIARVWEDSISTIRADLREWLRRLAESETGWIPHQFELAFGLERHGSRSADSVADPVEIADGLKLRGSIDMVERNLEGQFRVTDHKTGKARAKDNVIVGGGEHLQPLLYALAGEKLLGGLVAEGRLYYCTADGGWKERSVKLDPTNRGIVGLVIRTIGDAIESGFLPAAPGEGACTWCDFRPLCGPFEETRTKRKPNDRLQELVQIRKLS